jgi:hypothetical protein
MKARAILYHVCYPGGERRNASLTVEAWADVLVGCTNGPCQKYNALTLHNLCVRCPV